MKHGFKITVLALLCCAIFGSTSLLPTLPLLLLANFLGAKSRISTVLLQLANSTANNISGGFFIVAAHLLTRVVGIKCEAAAVLPGTIAAASPGSFSVRDIIKAPPRGKVTIVVSNHRTRVDWMLLWIIFAQATNVVYALKIVLKDELARLPFFGWAMQYFRFIFMSRSWENDAANMKAAVTYYKRYADATVLLIFPEGTDLHPAAQQKSNKFAKEQGQAEYEYVLHPRVTGLAALVEELGDALHEIIDVTMGFEDYVVGERPSEKTYFAGRPTRKLNVLLQRWKFGEAKPNSVNDANRTRFYWPDASRESVGKWVNEQFAKKELRLREYYTIPRPGAPENYSWMQVAYKLKLAPEANNGPTQAEGWVRLRSAVPTFTDAVIVPCLWAAGSLAVVGCVFSNAGLFSLFVLGCAFYVFESKYWRGIDQWLLFSLTK